MSDFIGCDSVAVDTENLRITIPARHRKLPLGEEFIIAKGFYGSLQIYRPEAFQLVLPTLLAYRKLHPNDRDAEMDFRAFQAEILELNENARTDAGGRIGLTKDQLKFAGIARQAFLVGAIDKIEVWEPGRYKRYRELLKARKYDELLADPFDLHAYDFGYI